MRTKDYIEATAYMLRAGNEPADVFARLKELLEERKQQSLLGKILKGVHVRVARRTELETPRLIIGRKSDVEAYQEEIAEASASLNLASTPRVEVDETLIGGFILLGNGSRIDRSHKTHLLNLYQSLTR